MDYKRITIKNSKGFTLIEMIAAMVLVSILVPGISSILGGTLMNIALTNIAILSNMEADHAQRKFMKHINGITSFSSVAGDQAADKLTFTSYLGGLEYQYVIDDASRTIKYSRDGPPAGILLQNVVGDTTIDAVTYTSKFTYKDKNNNNLSVPVASYTGTNVSFVGGGTKSVTVPSGNSFEDFVAGNIITILGSTSNNGTFTIASASANQIIVSESITTEGAGDAITVSIEVHGVELTFYLLRGESFYKYTTYATIDKNHLDL